MNNLLLCALGGLVPTLAVTPPNASDHVATARWMAATLTWGALSTTSTRMKGTSIGAPFGNPNSFADVNGVPYLYASLSDASMQDLFVAASAKPRASLALTEASLMDKDGAASLATCRIAACTFCDPENPPCSRLVLSGVISRLNSSEPEAVAAKDAIFQRHPSFKLMPASHAFFVAKLSIDSIWLISAYGGPANIKPSEYFNHTGVSPAPRAHIPAIADSAVEAPPQRPLSRDSHIKTARMMAKTLTWGFLSTTSTDNVGRKVGDAFGNPYSFADVGGQPYLFASDLDSSMKDLFKAAGASTRASIALSEASQPGKKSFLWKQKCQIGTVLGDPENPPCARLVLSGNATKLANGTAEEKAAKAALVARHPAFANLTPDFYVAKLNLEGIWLIDMFGGAQIIAPSDYLAADVA